VILLRQQALTPGFSRACPGFAGTDPKDNGPLVRHTDFPASDKILAWAHQYGKARVFGYPSGHDARVWTNESFKRLMGRGIRWAAGQFPEKE
jgi:type 1 glutamine amidotransferase